MKKSYSFVLSSFFLGVFLLLSVSGLAQVSSSLKFIENKNQWPGQFHYAAHVPGGRVFISPGQFSIYLFDEKLHKNHAHRVSEVDEADGKLLGEESINGQYVQISFLDANNLATPVPSNRSKEYYNYFLGNDSSRWASHAYAYAEVMYSSLYNGIDLKISSVNEHLKYDFIVQADSDPSQIRIEYCGADQLNLDYDDLSIETSVGKLVERKPYSYQLMNGVKREVRSEYQLEDNVLTFNFPDGYDPCFDLIIDPLLIFSTFSGSTADNWGSTATPGEQGTLYSSGITNHINVGGTFPATPGAFQTTYGGNYDIAILKYDSTGSQMLYASYLGGTSNETPHSLVMDELTKDLLVLGTTSSVDFPFTFGAFDNTFNGGVGFNTNVIPYPSGSDIVISRINLDGSVLLGSTFLGGSSNDGVNPAGPLVRNYGDNMRGDIITNDQGDIFISSVTGSTDFPAVNSFSTIYRGGVTDAVLLKIRGDLSAIEWSAFLGGSAYDASHTLKFDSDGNLFIGGGTTSSDFPVTSGVYQSVLAGDADGWIAHIQENGALVLHATFTGTQGFDQVYFVDLNTEGEVYVYGQTNGSMPVTPGVYSNPNSGQFVQKFSSDLSSLVFSTVFGSGIGIPNISPTAFLVNDCNNLYLSGWGGLINSGLGYWNSSTVGMPVTNDALQKTTSGSDFYFIVLTSDASELLYATYLGGNQSRTHVDGGTSRFDKSGIVYHAVCSGCKTFNATGHSTSDFPSTPGAWSRTNNSGNCNNAAFKFDLSSLRARIQTNSVVFNAPGLDVICYPDTIRFQNYSTGGEFFQWDLGDGTKFTKEDTLSFLHQYQESGTYLVKLKAIDQNTCVGVDSTSKVITVFLNTAKAQEDDDICYGTTYDLQATGGVTYVWSNDEDGVLSSTVVTPEDTTQYFVTITDSNGCIRKDSVLLNVVPEIDVKLEYELIADCFSRPSLLLRNNTNGKPDETFFFDFGDGFTSDAQEIIHHYEQDDEYVIRLVGVKEFCTYEEHLELPIYTIRVPNVFTPGVTPGLNDAFIVQYGELGQAPADVGLKVSVVMVNRWGTTVFESENYLNNWTAEEVEAGIYYCEVIINDIATCKSWIHVIK